MVRAMTAQLTTLYVNISRTQTLRHKYWHPGIVLPPGITTKISYKTPTVAIHNQNVTNVYDQFF